MTHVLAVLVALCLTVARPGPVAIYRIGVWSRTPDYGRWGLR